MNLSIELQMASNARRQQPYHKDTWTCVTFVHIIHEPLFLNSICSRKQQNRVIYDSTERKTLLDYVMCILLFDIQ